MTTDRVRGRTPLMEIAKRLKKALSDTACGPLVVAKDVVDLADRWGDYGTDTDGMSVSQWLVKTCGVGKDLRFFARRHEAVERIGEHIRRTWDHDAAVWAAGAIRDVDHLKRLDEAVVTAMRANGGNPLPESAVVRLAKSVLGQGRKLRSRKPCESCVAKDAEIAVLKARVAELEEMLSAATAPIAAE